VQVALLELKLKACLVRIMLDFSKLQLFYFLVSCISLNYYIPFLGLPNDSDFSRTVVGFNYLFWNIMSFLCVDNFVQLNVFFLPGCFMFDRAIPQSSMVAQAAPITNPFGTLPALPQMSIGRVGTTPSVQYGISSMPVSDVS
jgi:hypothetical protein